jgi:hypothetical protein
VVLVPKPYAQMIVMIAFSLILDEQ